MSGKRRHYRVGAERAGSLYNVSAIVSGEGVTGKLVDVSACGMRVEFPRVDPPIGVGSVVTLRVSSPHLEKPLDLLSITLRCQETDESRVYGFEFVDWLGQLERFPPELAELFNQRTACRVEPEAGRPVDVKVSGIDLPFEVDAQLRDISSAGLSFRAYPFVECVLGKAKVVRVSFELPGHTEVFSMVGRIRHRDLVGDHICYGLVFDDTRTERWSEQRRLLASYIDARRQVGLEQLAAGAPDEDERSRRTSPA